MSRTRRRATAAALTVPVVAAGALVVASARADAVACTGQVTYATSTNTIRLNSGAVDLPTLKALCPSAPLAETDPATDTWLLSANLVVQNGATLRVRGAGSGVTADQQVRTLRLLSRASGSNLEVVQVTANYGTLLFDHTAVTSWDDLAGTVDTNPSVGTATPGNPVNGFGRAFVRAISFMEGSTPRESRMDVLDSDLGYLGYYYAESYGVSYKGRGCDLANPAVCAALNVYGDQRNSRFHHNYMGTYVFNGYGMTFDGNEYDNNAMYGLDPHDDSDYLTITGNHAHHNGTHGIICSQRCDHLTITGNTSSDNGWPPYLPAGDPDISDNQVHGIMLHRGVTDSVVADNVVRNNNGAGIAVFDSMDNVIRDNLVEGNMHGLRTSVGSHDNVYRNNVVRGSTKYAVNAYPGTVDTAFYGIASSRPTREVFEGNTFDGSASNLVNLQSTDGFRFTGTTVTGTVGKVAAELSTGLVWDGGSAPGTGVYLTGGSAAGSARVRLPDSGAFKVAPGPNGTVTLTGPGGRLAEVSKSAFATVPASSGTATYTLNTALVGATSSVTVTPRPVTAVPATGSVQARITGFTSATKHLYLKGAAVGTSVSVTWGGLTPGRTYVVRVDNASPRSVTANASGVLAFTYVEATGGSHDLTVKTS